MTPLYITDTGMFCLGDDYAIYDKNLKGEWRVLISAIHVAQDTVDSIRSGAWAGSKWIEQVFTLENE